MFFGCFLSQTFFVKIFVLAVCLFVSLDFTIDTSPFQSSPTQSAQNSASTSYSSNQTPITTEKLLPSDPSTYSTMTTTPATQDMSTVKSHTASQSTATTSGSTNVDLATTTEPLSGVFVLIKYVFFSSAFFGCFLLSNDNSACVTEWIISEPRYKQYNLVFSTDECVPGCACVGVSVCVFKLRGDANVHFSAICIFVCALIFSGHHTKMPLPGLSTTLPTDGFKGTCCLFSPINSYTTNAILIVCISV